MTPKLIQPPVGTTIRTQAEANALLTNCLPFVGRAYSKARILKDSKGIKLQASELLEGLNLPWLVVGIAQGCEEASEWNATTTEASWEAKPAIIEAPCPLPEWAERACKEVYSEISGTIAELLNEDLPKLITEAIARLEPRIVYSSQTEEQHHA